MATATVSLTGSQKKTGYIHFLTTTVLLPEAPERNQQINSKRQSTLALQLQFVGT